MSSDRLRWVLALAVLPIGGAALSGCVDPKPSSPTPKDIQDIDVSPDHTITVDEEGFHPASLEIRPGEVVLLVNDGSELHSFTAEERFDTGRLEPGEDTTLVLTEPGEIPYRDLEDPEADAVLTVLPAADG
jgi:plastocyanin